MWSLSFAPLVPLPLLIGLSLLAALAAGAAIALAGRSAILRALALAVLTITLADPRWFSRTASRSRTSSPSWSIARPRTGLPIAASRRRPHRPRSSGNCAA